MDNCPYEAYLTYQKSEKGANNVYGVLGGCIHDKLEEIINGEAVKGDLRKALDNDLENLNLLGLSFPKDFKGGDSIRENWIKDMEHFVENFETPPGKFNTEEFLIYKVDDDHYLQGYADLVRLDNESGSEQSIFDWKTSSMYDAAGFKEHGRQLVIYALAKEQQGININQVAWFFLKYVTVSFKGKLRSNSKKKTDIIKHINRRKIGSELERYIKDDLIEAGYDDVDIEMYISNLLLENSLDNLPQNIKSNYMIQPCVIYYELSDEVKNECKEYIINTINKFETLGNDEKNWNHKPFEKVTKYGNVKEDTFYCNSLCGHAKRCKYLIEYNENKMAEQIELESFLC